MSKSIRWCYTEGRVPCPDNTVWSQDGVVEGGKLTYSDKYDAGCVAQGHDVADMIPARIEQLQSLTLTTTCVLKAIPQYPEIGPPIATVVPPGTYLLVQVEADGG